MGTPQPDDAREEDLGRLFDAVYERYGVDFRGYVPSTMRRRVRACLLPERVADVPALCAKVLDDPACFERLVGTLTVHTTTMFRDPPFYRAFRDRVVPLLATWPFIRIWHAGCSTGEEAYSTAILLHETGLDARARIYATDLSEPALARARAAVYPAASVQEFTANYRQAGGIDDFSRYYTASGGQVILRPFIRRTVVFAQHSLVGDSGFNEFHTVLCRNVLIYFNPALQARVHRLLYDSLARLGVLGLGEKETLRFTPHEAAYVPVDAAWQLYQKRK